MTQTAAPQKSLSLGNVEYEIIETDFAITRKFVYQDGSRFEEYKSRPEFLGLPLVHKTYGKDPATGKRIPAKGVIAIGRTAYGFLAIGQMAWGIIAIGQLGLGFLFGLGQASCGIICVGQLAIGGLFGLGQFAGGFLVIGQFAVGEYVLAQIGYGSHVVDTRGADPAAMKLLDLFW